MRPRVVMYSTNACPHCTRAEDLLKKKGVEAIDKVRVDLDSKQREEMMIRTGRRTIPQIYIGELHVGGADDLYALDREGKLDALLSGESSLSRS